MGENLVGLQYLVVEATVTIEVLEERTIRLTAPEVQIGDLKIAPNYFVAMSRITMTDAKPFLK